MYLYIYIYIYTYREKEREREFVLFAFHVPIIAEVPRFLHQPLARHLSSMSSIHLRALNPSIAALHDLPALFATESLPLSKKALVGR